MRRFFSLALPALLSVTALGQEGFNRIPRSWKWISSDEVIFTYDGTFADSTAFVYDAAKGRTLYGRTAPEEFSDFPLHPQGAVNMTYSPDFTRIAFTRDNDLYVADIADGKEIRLTFDGTDLILNGYASWVYYEEIFGRPTRYKAFWWSPDGSKLGFYRFDNTCVPLFPIYSAAGQDGSLRQTRYPKAGETNPRVQIGMIDVDKAESGRREIVWADFDPEDDQYFGTPFWGDDSKSLYVTRMPRVQNTIDLYAVDAADGSKKHIYNETYPTWIDWIGDVIFSGKGLYMARSFETGWQQIYFLSYDGNEFRRLTDGENWSVSLIREDEKTGDVYFTAQRDSRVRSCLYKVSKGGEITALTDTSLNVASVSFSPDGKYFAAALSNAHTPTKVVAASSSKGAIPGAKGCAIVADMAPEGFSSDDYALPELVWITTEDGFRLPAQVTYPADFDPAGKYPVHVDIYGGPDSPQVKDRWMTPSPNSRWWGENGIIEVVADCRAAGQSGRAGTDMVYRDLVSYPVKDFIAWADWLKSLPYVDGDKIGVEGFSFGGTMTAALLFTASDSYHYGIAGGGVYDWKLYDSHYTERFMDTPENNPDGYAIASAINYASSYPINVSSGSAGGRRPAPGGAGMAPGVPPVPASAEADRRMPAVGAPGHPDAPISSESAAAIEPVMLKITHGTGDDNVHFQNTLQLVDELQKYGKKFELMIYPDGMHGYRGYQGEHFNAANRSFWLKYLKNR